MLHIEELRHGTRVRATSWVGRITLGSLQITVEPKITGMPLLRLLRYAYGLRNLDLFGASSYDLSTLSFLDLLIHQLAAEAEELMRRGLRREYIRQQADLTFPRGRLEVQRYVRNAATVSATLPCSFYPRAEDTAINQVLLAGLRLGSRLTTDLALRATLASRCRVLEEGISDIRLDRQTLLQSRRSMSRLTTAYEPTLALIELLVGMQGVNLEGETDAIAIPGFLFDMNRFFQALLSRFLSENLAGYQVRDEQRLRGMMTYDPMHNPRRRPMPAPRPDFVVLQANQMVAVLDAKYRDLWANPLPRDMLYQLAIYALIQQERRTAIILYPTLDTSATEAHIVINDTVDGRLMGRVILRPVNMLALEALVSMPQNEQERHAYAQMLVFGTEQSSL
ncbi:MAG TPA: hypothetical protein VFA07_00940 [Chthonomonadaceae bacterium]|nr:hypothetical protein [Chthonomonadaceae bacterium]